MSQFKYASGTDAELSASAEIINVQIIIDTDKLCANYPKQENPDPMNAQGLPHDYQYMVVSSQAAISGTASADLKFKANVGDVIRFNMTSEFANFENPVMMYDVRKSSGDDVFGPFSSRVFRKQGIVPQIGPSPLPVQCEELPFWFFQSDVLGMGTENFLIYFALYYRERGNPCPQVYGYYFWDPAIVVES